MKKTQIILNATGLTYREYDAWRFMNFTDWCFAQAKKYGLIAKLLIRNDGMLNWYSDMWMRHVEEQFIRDNVGLLEVQSQKDIQLVLMTYPGDLLAFYPPALFKRFKAELTPNNDAL